MKKQSKDDSNALQKVAQLEARIRELEEKLARAESLRENEQRYRLLFDSAEVLVSVYDRDGVCQLMNQRIAALFGGTPQDFIGKSFHDLHPEAAGEYLRRIRQAIDAGVSREYEDEVRFPSGSRWLLSRVQPVPDGQGVFCIAQIISQDITEQKQAEKALMESEEKYRTIFEQSPLGIFRSTFAGRFIEVNPALARILGYDSPEAVLREIHDISKQIYIHSEKREIIVSKQFLSPEVSQYLNRYRRRDGSEFIANLYLKTIRDAQGNPAFFEGIVEDITERKQTEKALMESEARYRCLAENFPNGVLFLFDQEFRYLAADGKGLARAGLSSDQIVGKTVKAVFPELWETIHPHCQAALEGRESDFEVTYNGRIYANQALPIFSGGEIQPQALVVTLDITEAREAEAEKARLEAEVHQSQKLESIGRLAGGVAHDLNNLLFPIIGYAELLADEFKPEQSGFEFAGEIKKAGIRARDLVRQLLAFSRKQTLEYKPLDLNQVIVNFEKLLRRTIREDIAIRYILYPHIQTIMADLGQIEQVIMNLAVNAADAMPDGGQLNIETWQTEVDASLAAFHPGIKPGPYAILAISDTGCGMEAETRARIFEPFFSTKGGKGTGLGLATVYGIVRQHGGDIAVYSEPGQGSCFKVYLPVSHKPTMVKEAKTQDQRASGGFETLLLAEDDPQVRQLAHTVLVQHQYTVLVAENGEEALEILAAHDGPLDLLLTDVVMPQMNGRELYARVAERFPEIKVLYMSGYTDDVIAHHGILEAGVKFIQKPFSVQDLAARVREVLDG